MNNKLTMKRDVVTRWVMLLIAASLFSYVIGELFDKEPEPVKLEGNSKWCVYGEFADLDEFRDATSLPNVFVDIKPNGSVRIFTPCNQFYD